MLGEPSHDPHPLGWRRRCDLPLQHGHRVCERANAIPTELHVKAESAANDMQVIVNETRQHSSALAVALERSSVVIRPRCRIKSGAEALVIRILRLCSVGGSSYPASPRIGC